MALAGGIAFTVLSNRSRSDADGIRATIVNANGDCTASSPSFAGQCKALYQSAEDRDLYGNVAVAGYLIAGGAAVATTLYLLVPRPEPSGAETPAVRVVPAASPYGGGIRIEGTF